MLGNGLVEDIVFMGADFLLGENPWSMIMTTTTLVHCSLLEGVALENIDFWWCLGGVWAAAIRIRSLQWDFFYVILLYFLAVCIGSATRVLRCSVIGIFGILIYSLYKKSPILHKGGKLRTLKCWTDIDSIWSAYLSRFYCSNHTISSKSMGIFRWRPHLLPWHLRKNWCSNPNPRQLVHV
jgi:hypothetical protein